MYDAISLYSKEVKDGEFPSEKESFELSEDEKEKLKEIKKIRDKNDTTS